ncbi:MAG: Ig-like domain-containing protein [Candidatus Nanoarchaeia archaeon]|nr:Ig-like domain-containing protein [Candidatus Nanoarchaeia archaeon]
MVHKRYIKKGGKLYGPYLYKSVRGPDGKVKNIYLGDVENEKKDVVQNKLPSLEVFFILAIFLLGLFFFKTYTGFSIATDPIQIESTEPLSYNIEKTADTNVIDLYLDQEKDSKDSTPKARIRGIKKIPPDLKIKVAQPQESFIKTEVLSLSKEVSIENATLTLKAYDKINAIYHCQNYDFSKAKCDEWVETDIPFEVNGDYVTFTVYGFTAYAGGLPDTSNLTLWDSSDPENDTLTLYSGTNAFFFANYTNSTGEITINDTTATCSVNFNLTGDYGTPTAMVFNEFSQLFEYNRTFNVKGTFYFNATCVDTVYTTLEANDTFTISNTAPVITQDVSGFIQPPWECYEDQICTYNLSENITDPDTNDILNYTYAAGTTLSCFDIDFHTGIMNLTCTTETQTGSINTILITSDSDSASDSATLNITVYPVNDTPKFSNIPDQSLIEDTAYTYTVSGSDEENDAYSFEDNSSFFEINPSTGLISFTPTNTEVGDHQINISINDSLGCYSQIVRFIISNVNDAPVLDYICDNQTLTEDVDFNCTVNATDVDGNTLTFSLNETWLDINSTGYINVTPTDTDIGEHRLNLTVSDGSLIDSAIINFSVIGVNDAPLITTAENITGYEGITWYYDFNATDGDLDSPGTTEFLTWSINESYITISSSTGIASFTPSLTNVGENWINVTVNDSTGIEDSVIINLTVYANNAPVFTPNTEFSLTEDIEFYFNFTLNATDADNDALFFYSNDSVITINETTGEINITPNDTSVGENWINLSVKDLPGYYVSGIVNLTVINVNDNPNITSRENHTVNEDDTLSYIFNATDEDLNIPSTWEVLTWEDNSSFFDIGSSNGVILFTPTNDSFAGDHFINVTVRDTTGLTDEWIFNLSIYAVNDRPNITSTDQIIGRQDEALVYDVNATDEEDSPEGQNGSLTFNTNTTWANFIINITSGQITFTPNSSQTGIELLNITVNDSLGLEDSRIFTINISDVNDPVTSLLGTPSGNIAGIDENASQAFTVYVNDPDTGQALYYNWYVDNILNVTSITSTQSNAFTYYANYTDEGTHNVTVIISDLTYEASWYWNLTVSNVNAPPEFYAEIANISFNQDTSYTLLNLDDYFRDYDYGDARYNQTLNFTFIQMNETEELKNSTDITITVSNTSNMVTITPRSGWTGYEIVQAILNDSEYEVAANNFSINVTSAVLPTVSVPSAGGGGGGGGGGGATEYVTIDILHPGDVSLFLGERIITPIKVKNTGDVLLSDINLEASASTKDITLNLNKIKIDKLSPGEEVDVDLEIITDKDTKEGKRDITVKAIVSDPSVTDSIKFFVSLLEFGLEDKQLVKEKLRYLKDMLNENPECLELQEYINKADMELATGRFSQAMELTRQGIEGCKEIVLTLQEKEQAQKPTGLSGENLPLFLLELVAMAFILFIAYRFYRRRKNKI